MMHLLTHAVAASLAVASAHVVRPAEQVVVIHAKDYAFVAPKTIKASGPITFRLVNDGKELHHATIVKIGAGKTMKDVAEALKKQGPPPTWMTDVGGPNPALPGGTAQATLNLEAGTYAVLCFINTPGEPMPHMAKGMVGSFTVEAAPGVIQAGEAKGDVTIRTSDYKFALSAPLTAGHHNVAVVNDAAQSHEVVVGEMAPGKTAQDLSNWVEKEMMKGPPPGKPIGGIAAMAKGRSGIFPLDLTSGKTYVLICFVPDAKDGKGHSTHGMVQTFTVK